MMTKNNYKIGDKVSFSVVLNSGLVKLTGTIYKNKNKNLYIIEHKTGDMYLIPIGEDQMFLPEII